MKTYNNLELDILSCLLQRPELMEKVKFEDKHIIKYNRLWIFMKAVYKKFGDFDIPLMTTVTRNKNKFINYIEILIDREPAPSNFEKYQDRLINLYNESEKEKFLEEKILNIAMDLYVGNINVEKFKNRLDGIFHIANELYGSD